MAITGKPASNQWCRPIYACRSQPRRMRSRTDGKAWTNTTPLRDLHRTAIAVGEFCFGRRAGCRTCTVSKLYLILPGSRTSWFCVRALRAPEVNPIPSQGARPSGTSLQPPNRRDGGDRARNEAFTAASILQAAASRACPVKAGIERGKHRAHRQAGHTALDDKMILNYGIDDASFHIRWRIK